MNLPASYLATLIAKVTEHGQQHHQDPLLDRFIQHYLKDVPAEDLLEKQPIDLYGMALMHWRLAQQRGPGETRLRVYNPQFEEHGWQSNHSVVELVADDMPFVVDSVALTLARRGLARHLIIHPVLGVTRDSKGQLQSIHDPLPAETQRETYLHLEIDRQSSPAELTALEAALRDTLRDVSAAVQDWPAMRAHLAETEQRLRQLDVALDSEERDEAADLLNWLAHDHFTLLGYRVYDLDGSAEAPQLLLRPGSGLGILRDQGVAVPSRSFAILPLEVRQLAFDPVPLVVAKSNHLSTVHRQGYLDYLGIKRFDDQGQVIGEERFLGLFTAEIYSRSVRDIPLIRKKVAHVMADAGVQGDSHRGKALLNVLEHYPRDELFAINETELLDTALGIMNLQDRQKLRVFVRRDPFQRYVSCLVFAPRDNYNTEVRQKMSQVLLEVFQGSSIEFNVSLTESVLARIHFTIRTTPGTALSYHHADLEQRLATTCRRWRDDLYQATLEHMGEELGNSVFRSYADGFPVSYQADYLPRAAVHDMERMHRLTPDHPLDMILYTPATMEPGLLQFKLFHLGAPILLSTALPMLENLGVTVLEERPHKLRGQGGRDIWLSDFAMRVRDPAMLEHPHVRAHFQEAFAQVASGHMENDAFNKLVLLAGLHWRQVVILRSYARYLRQVQATYSLAYMEDCLQAYPDIARQLVALFEARFDPALPDRSACQQSSEQILSQLEQVASLDHDKILRAFHALILATLRTNFYQVNADQTTKPYLSFKLDPAQVPDMPEPRPMFEIFVYAPHVEGVHLRGGKVARGGLRWSDRKEDFRTEVLGLVKAQMVKNSVIVPVGSKGGFIVKRPPPSGERDALQQEGIRCYQDFIRGLLDVTDNLVAGQLVPPANTVRLDGDDPYLVVAADKGTASFSDIANQVAQERGFWLGDAFASGGSAGYDHKKMGITARGAWESVKRHFLDLGVDVQTQDFTVVGVGDMSGDVFGNGMLLSPHIRLVAAFDHRHIFIDPNPDAVSSLAERQRLFQLPRSSWGDYEPKLLSKGGGVWPRSAKTIPLSPEIRSALDVSAEQLSPNELIRAILRAPVDLLYNGGIGTYVKASHQSHAEANDRGTDAVRVDGRDLRCRVVAEGGNLGFTQLARLEYALRGGRIYTDAIDNSAGVDCSDHEVNIKILLNGLVDGGDMTTKQRNQLLADMTLEVAQLVLRDNYEQTLALKINSAEAHGMLEVQGRLMRHFEKLGKLNRRIEFLPNEEALQERKLTRQGLTPPELAVLLAYSKMALYDELLHSTLPDDPYYHDLLTHYFPEPLRDPYQTHMTRHYLQREIVATVLCNRLINRMDPTMAYRFHDEIGVDMAQITRAWTVAADVFHASALWQQIEALDGRIPAPTQISMFLEVRKLLERATRWLLRNWDQAAPTAELAARYRHGAQTIRAELPEWLRERDRDQARQHQDTLMEQGVPANLASTIAGCETWLAGLDIIDIAEAEQVDLSTAGQTYFMLGASLRLDWLRQAIVALPRDNRWCALARAALRDDLARQQHALTVQVLRHGTAGQDAEPRYQHWQQARAQGVERCLQVFAELEAQATLDLAMLSAALREIRNQLL